jgi:hypothetical protein
MKYRLRLLWIAPVLCLALAGPLVAQPILFQPPGQNDLGTRIGRVSVVKQSEDKTEVLLSIECSYDGMAGASAVLLPIVQKKGRPGVSGWFGCDPPVIPQGKATISLKMKYFNDEPGVPPEFTSDQLIILILNSSKVARLFNTTVLKTITWGSPKAVPAQIIAPKPDGRAEALAAEARARDAARRAGEAEEKTRAEAAERDRQIAANKAQEQETARLEAEALKLAQAKIVAEKQARIKAEEEVKRAEAARLAAEKAQQEEAAAAEAKAREAARIAVEKEAKARADAEERDRRMAAKKAQELEKARLEAEALKVSQAKAESEKQARLKAEDEAKRLADARQEAEATRQRDDITPDASLKTKITNLDVVNRSLDRSQMTIGVEFEYKDALQKPAVGVDVWREGEPDTRHYFAAQATEIGKSRRNFVLVPVKFQPPKPEDEQYDAYPTDEVLVYLQDATQSRKNLSPTSLKLTWHSPLARKRKVAAAVDSSLQIDEIKQNDLFSGYVTARYNLTGAAGAIRLMIFDSGNLKSIEWFATPELPVGSGAGLQILKFAVRQDASSPVDIIKTDTIQLDLADESGRVVATASRNSAFTWAKPK